MKAAIDFKKLIFYLLLLYVTIAAEDYFFLVFDIYSTRLYRVCTESNGHMVWVSSTLFEYNLCVVNYFHSCNIGGTLYHPERYTQEIHRRRLSGCGAGRLYPHMRALGLRITLKCVNCMIYPVECNSHFALQTLFCCNFQRKNIQYQPF